MARIRPGTALYGLLFGDDEGEVRLAKGTVSYSYDDDRFRMRDNQGREVWWIDCNRSAEAWLIREGWVKAVV